MCSHACFSEVENIVLLRLEPPLSTSPGVGGFPKPFFSCTFMELNARALSRSCLPLGASLHVQSEWMSLCSAFRLSRHAVLRVH